MNIHFETLLRAVAVAQIVIACLNLALVRIMKWHAEVERMPLLIREVFHVHGFFISVTLAIFATLTWRFARDIATSANPLCVWFAAAIGIFWATRTIMQWTFYSASHWRGDRSRTIVHWALTFLYGGFAVVYFAAAI